MAAVLLPNGKQQFIDINGNPLVAGTVGMYVPNTLIKKTTWQDANETILNTNPIELDERGQAIIYGEGVYRQIVRDEDGNLIWDELTSSAGGGNAAPSVNIMDFGAVRYTDSPAADNYQAIQDANDYAQSVGAAVYIPWGIFRILSTLFFTTSIFGDGPAVSIIYNAGTGDGVNLNFCDYYNTFQNFSIKGNSLSRDGLTLVNPNGDFGVGDPNASYCHLVNIYSYENGRHGFHHRMAFATRYLQCKSYSNLGLGWLFYSEPTDLGTANGVTCIQCDSRNNGAADALIGDNKGGVRIQGASVLLWEGGVVEANEPYGFNIGAVPGGSATRVVTIRDCYLELNGFNSTLGYAFYATGPWADISVDNCSLSYGADTGNTNYLFNFVASLDNGNFDEGDNTYIVVGGGTATKYAGTHFAGPQVSANTDPAFKAYLNASVSTFSIPNATVTKVPINVEQYDTNSNFDIATNIGRFTPTQAGFYHFNAVAGSVNDVGSSGYIGIRKNGTDVDRGPNLITGAAVGMIVETDLYMNGTTDYVELVILQTSGGAYDYNPAAGICSFRGFRFKNT